MTIESKFNKLATSLRKDNHQVAVTCSLSFISY